MSDTSWQDPNKDPVDGEVAFDYIKGPHFRVVWVDGVIGGVTPNKHLQFTMFAERPAIPRRQVFKMDAVSGQLGVEVVEKRISRQSVVREMACDVHMSAEAAQTLAEWLLERVQQMKNS